MADPRGPNPAHGLSATEGSLKGLAQLALAALTGSNDDRARFLGACRQHAYAIALRLGQRHHGAEDTAQDVTIAVAKLLNSAPPALLPESIDAFVFTVTLRSVRETTRSRVREVGLLRDAPKPAQPPDVAVQAEAAEAVRRVRMVVAALPRLARRLVELRYWDDLSLDQIGRVVGASRMSVARLLGDLEAALRNNLRGLHDPDERHGHSGHTGPPGP